MPSVCNYRYLEKHEVACSIHQAFLCSDKNGGSVSGTLQGELYAKNFEILPKIESRWSLISLYGPILLTWINFNISEWISNHIHNKAWDEMDYPFPNFNGTTVEVWELISDFIALWWMQLFIHAPTIGFFCRLLIVKLWYHRKICPSIEIQKAIHLHSSIATTTTNPWLKISGELYASDNAKSISTKFDKYLPWSSNVSVITVYPKKYAHGFCFAVLCCGYTLTDFPISIRLTSLALMQSNDCPSASKATLINMDKYFTWIHYERLHNHNKAKHNKTVCIFLGIYCMTLIGIVISGCTGSQSWP